MAQGRYEVHFADLHTLFGQNVQKPDNKIINLKVYYDIKYAAARNQVRKEARRPTFTLLLCRPTSRLRQVADASPVADFDCERGHRRTGRRHRRRLCLARCVRPHLPATVALHSFLTLVLWGMCRAA